MTQDISADTYALEDWDVASAQRVFVTLLHAKDWKAITGEAAPNQPPTAKEYSQAGLPWFNYYGRDQAVLPGGQRFAGLKSLATLFKQVTGADLPASSDVKTGTPRQIGPSAGKAGPSWTATTCHDSGH